MSDINIDKLGFPICENCGESNWLDESTRGDAVCGGCGLCMEIGYAEHIPMGSPRKRRKLETNEPTPSDLSVRKLKTPAKKKRYKRSSYWRERFSQLFLHEPAIREGDLESIDAAYSNYCCEVLGTGFRFPSKDELNQSKGKPIPGSVILSKKDIRNILKEAEELKKVQDKERFEDDCKYDFVKRYAEKWLSIRFIYSGLVPRLASSSTQLIEWVLLDLETLEFTFVRNYSKKSFPNFNMVVRNILKFYNCEDMVEYDLPALNTMKAKRKFARVWWTLCENLSWPFLVDDVNINSLFRKQKENKGDG